MFKEPIPIRNQPARPERQSEPPAPQIGVIIVSYNTRDQLALCLESLRAQNYAGKTEIIVVDNASGDRSAEMVSEQFPDVTLIANQENLGFAAANNQAFTITDAEMICLVNPDTLVCEGALTRSVEHLIQNPETGLCGGLLVDEDGQRHPSGRRFPSALGKLLTLSGLAARFPDSKFFGGQDYGWFDYGSPIQVEWVPGAFTCSLNASPGWCASKSAMYTSRRASGGPWKALAETNSLAAWVSPERISLSVSRTNHDASSTSRPAHNPRISSKFSTSLEWRQTRAQSRDAFSSPATRSRFVRARFARRPMSRVVVTRSNSTCWVLTCFASRR
ncbi:MAG: glycosyltransferase family 2 protein [Verrucomicrobiales bacterium]